MAARSTQWDRAALLRRLTDLWAVVAVGAAGAVTLQKYNYPQLGQVGGTARTYTAASTTGGGTTYPAQYGQGWEGIRSVARTAAGLWTVTLQDNYQRLVGIDVMSRLAGGLSAIVHAAENTTISNMPAAGGSVIGVALLSATATALDPASGETIVLHFTLQDATS